MGRSGLGTVVICVVSKTRILVVRDEMFPNPLWKLPGGSIEREDSDVIAAAIREVMEETGVELVPEELEVISEQHIDEDGRYHPYLCIARVTEEKMDTRLPVAEEDGNPMRTDVPKRAIVSTMKGFLDRHRDFICEVEMAA